MKSFIIKITILFLIIIGCENNDDIPLETNVEILGSWVNPKYSNNGIEFERSKNLLEDYGGISFLSKNVFIERNSGWCGTPPLVFSNYQGVWKKNNLTLEIEIDNGINGMDSSTWEIKLLNNNTLIIEKTD